MRLVIHPGFGKCASSSLQATLSLSPVYNLDSKRRFHYLCLGKDSILSGEHITKRARASAFDYASSVNASVLSKNSEKLNHLLEAVLEEYPSEDLLILSCEGWCQEPAQLNCLPVLQSLAEECVFISLVRAPVSWINSAFWQWGAWSNVSQETWINKAGLRGANWFQSLMEIADVFPHAQHKVIPLTRGTDVIEAFFAAIGMQHKFFKKLRKISNNTSLPLEILHLYLRFPELRPDPHSSAIDFKIGRLLSDKTLTLLNRKPWAITHAQVSILIDLLSQSVDNLADRFLNKESTNLLKADEEWLSAKAYLKRDYVSVERLRSAPVFGSKAAEALLRDVVIGVNRQ